jgi:CBS-domain-containing membrane protein
MIVAKDIMSTELITFAPEMDFVTAARILLDKRINGAPVVDSQGRLIGILCQSDLIAQQKRMPVPALITVLDSFIQLTSAKQLEKQIRKIVALTVAEAMTPDPITVQPDTRIETVAALMVDSNLHTLPVVDGATLVGIIGKEDVLRTLLPQDISRAH